MIEKELDMRSLMNRCAAAMLASGSAVAIAMSVGTAQSQVKCDPDNGGLKLPAGFCAQVVAEDIPTARHLVVAHLCMSDAIIGRSGRALAPGHVLAFVAFHTDQWSETGRGMKRRTRYGWSSPRIIPSFATASARSSRRAPALRSSGRRQPVSKRWSWLSPCSRMSW